MNVHWLKNPICYFFQALVVKAAWLQYQRQGVLIYLKSLQAIRRGVAGSLLVFLFLQTMILGLVGTSVAVVFLAVEDGTHRLWALLGIFAVLFIVPLLTICYLMSERAWFRLSGAGPLVEQLSKQNQ
jgi:hypothetical protein